MITLETQWANGLNSGVWVGVCKKSWNSILAGKKENNLKTQNMAWKHKKWHILGIISKKRKKAEISLKAELSHPGL